MAHEWVKCSDRLPPEGRYGIVYSFKMPVYDNKVATHVITGMSRYTKDRGWLAATPDSEVIYWIELPEIPMEAYGD